MARETFADDVAFLALVSGAFVVRNGLVIGALACLILFGLLSV
ncbi:hypothetical protein [Pseudorhodoplanes sp.]|jgi:hypothetical protein|nr:hypothetical protein [Pseudorhodoplanes sp.]HWV40631.1 hypothetical protein [Pseudorhodoplanes sp.]